jgi:hypothetical protein
MLEQAHSIVVLLTSEFSHHLLVMALAGGDVEDAVLSAEGAIVVRPGRVGDQRALHRDR